jgi:hypothetical protein
MGWRAAAALLLALLAVTRVNAKCTLFIESLSRRRCAEHGLPDCAAPCVTAVFGPQEFDLENVKMHESDFGCATINHTQGTASVMHRGECVFTHKVYSVQRGGAAAAVVVNSAAGSNGNGATATEMTSSGLESAPLVVPSVMVGMETGSKLLRLIRVSSALRMQ